MFCRIFVFLTCAAITSAVFGQSTEFAKLKLTSSSEIDETLADLNSKITTLGFAETFSVKEWEVIDAIQGQTSNQSFPESCSDELEKAVKEILSTKQLPSGTKLEMSRTGVVTLELPLEGNSTFDGFGFIIRHPGLQRHTDGSYRMDYKWKPSTTKRSYDWNGKEWLGS